MMRLMSIIEIGLISVNGSSSRINFGFVVSARVIFIRRRLFSESDCFMLLRRCLM